MLNDVLIIFQKYQLLLEKAWKYATLQDRTNCFISLNKLFSQTEKNYYFLNSFNVYNQFVNHINDIFDKMNMQQDIFEISEKIHQIYYQNNVLIIKLGKAIQQWNKVKKDIFNILN